jgi:hypothetical protein
MDIYFDWFGDLESLIKDHFINQKHRESVVRSIWAKLKRGKS